jgi:lipopolysaccharide assembly protein A
MQIFLFFALFIALVAAVFAMQNSDTIQVTFLMWHFQSSLAAVLLITLAAGALISTLVSMPSNVKARWIIRQQRKKMNDMENHLTEMRTELDTARQISEETLPVVEKEEPEKTEDSQLVPVNE